MRTGLCGIAFCAFVLGGGTAIAVQPTPLEHEIPFQHWSPPAFFSPEVQASSPVGRGSGPGVEITPSFPTAPMPYVAITPCRLLDTRSTSTLTGQWGPPTLIPNTSAGPISSDRSFTSTATAQCPGIPAGARAVAANVTAIGFTADGRITVFPADASTRPLIASVNMRTPVPYAPALAQGYAIVPLDTTGSFRAFANTATDLIVDVNGYYAPAVTFAPVSDIVLASETTTSSTWDNLGTIGPAVTVSVPPSGKVLVTLSALITAFDATGNMGLAVTGPSPSSPTWGQSLTFESASGLAYHQGSWTRLFSGLTPGNSTFTAKYRAGTASLSGYATFEDRQIVVTPVP